MKRMPGTACDGRVVIEAVTWDEVRTTFCSLGDGRVFYLKRRRDEDHDGFVERVLDFCEKNVGEE